MKTAEELLEKTHSFQDDTMGKCYEYDEVYNLMIQFAKMHVEQALQQISSKSFEVKSQATNEMLELVTKQSVLTAYPLDNIK